MVRRRPCRSDLHSVRRIARPPRDVDTPAQNRPARRDLPTRFHPVRLPLSLLQDPPPGGNAKCVRLGRNIPYNIVHQFSDTVRSVMTDKFSERPAVDLASRTIQALCERFGLGEDVIRYRDSYFHTISITSGSDPCQCRQALPYSAKSAGLRSRHLHLSTPAFGTLSDFPRRAEFGCGIWLSVIGPRYVPNRLRYGHLELRDESF